MIRLHRLRKTYAGAVALESLSLEVERGEVMGLLGPNGAGKTTCLRVLTCFVPPTSGEAWVDGLEVRRHSQAIRQRLGYLPEGVPLYPELRVTELLRFSAGLRGLGSRQTRREIDRVTGLCGLGEVRRQVVGTLSRGYRQRLGLATALVGDPPLVVLDEPTVGLDPNQIREVRQLIRDLGGSHTVLLSTHVLTEVEAVCSRAAIIHRGRLVECGPVDQLRGGTHTIVVGLRGEAGRAEAVLAGVTGVQRVEPLPSAALGAAGDAGEPVVWLRLHGELDAGHCEAVAVAVLGAGMGLQQLRLDCSTLEEAFARATAGSRVET